MSKTLKQLWQLLKTDIKELGKPADLVESGADLAKNIFDCAVPLGLLATPLMPAAPFVSAGFLGLGLTARFVKLIKNRVKEELTLQDWVLLAAQFAYIDSFQTILNLSKNTDLINQIANTQVSEDFNKKLERLENLDLTEAEAKEVLRCFHGSKLAPEFNSILLTLLTQTGLSVNEAEILTKRVAWGTHRYLNEALASATENVPALAQLYRDGWRKESEKYHSLDEYLEKQIAAKPQEPVFHESFTFQEIYVPVEVMPVDNKSGEIKKDAEAIVLETWAKDLLLNLNKQNQVMFIQGGPGRGKSVFCRMFADRVHRELHPIWTPILIRLRDISTFEKNFKETIESVLYTADFVNNDNGWLTDKNTRYLFLLDGFDELLMEGRTSGGLQDFLRQVGQFQEDCHRSSEMGHRVLITGRSLALHSIEKWLPHNIERVEIIPMSEALQQQWFVKWEAIVGTAKNQAFQTFLNDKNCPDRVRELAKEPLLLYLLAAMHRDGEIKVEDFAGVSSANAKILIYEKALDWVLTKQRPAWLNHNLTQQETEDLQRILTEAGLCVVQSGGECAAISMIEERLNNDDSAKALLEEAQKHLGESALKNALATFYLQTGRKEGSVEFCHKSFGEFLCAKRIKESLIDWAKTESKPKKFKILDEQYDWEIYDLLGYGGLTPEIVEYLTPLLTGDDKFRPIELFQRLEDFYFHWCEGEFIDAPPENLPQKKMRILKEQVKTCELGQRQVDIYAGLNVMILLLELNRYAQSQDELKYRRATIFYPCGRPNTENFDKNRLLRIIGYCHCIDVDTFTKLVGSFLSRGAKLSGANLSSTNLRDVNLRDADLRSAKLSNANLIGANLRGADLRGADLRGADLSNAILIGADLSRAILIGADLSYADLSHADLSHAYLSGAKLSDAKLSNAILIGASLIGVNLSNADLSHTNFSRAHLEYIRWDKYTNWENVEGLKIAINVPEALKQQLVL
jgi:hypothetical protein